VCVYEREREVGKGRVLLVAWELAVECRQRVIPARAHDMAVDGANEQMKPKPLEKSNIRVGFR
jgi:hypothetical protein